MKRKLGYVLLLLAMAGLGHAIGYGADKLNRKYTGRSLVRTITNAKCTPCEQAAIDRIKAEKKGETK